MTNFREKFAQLDPREDLNQIRDRLTALEQSGGGGGGTIVSNDTVPIDEYGGAGNGEDDDTEALKLSLAEAAEGRVSTVRLPTGEYPIGEAVTIPEGVELEGDGERRTVFRSENDESHTVLDQESYTSIRDLTLDVNATGRSSGGSRGINIKGVNDCAVENVSIRDISDNYQGVGIFILTDDDVSQDTYNIRIENCRLEGGYQNGDNSGDFLIRARTPFRRPQPAEDFKNKIRDVDIVGCTFTGEGKAAIELVGPATVECRVARCVARNFVTCTGIFESSLGAKRNTFENSAIIDCFGDSTCIGFYSDGFQVSGVPERRAEDDLYLGCRVHNFRQIRDGSSIRAFRSRRADRIKFSDCFATDIAAPGSGDAVAFNVTRSNNTIIDSPLVNGAEIAVQESGAVSGLDVDNATFLNVDR